MTLLDALNLAYAVNMHRLVKDTNRYKRAYDIARDSLQGFQGMYDVSPYGESFSERVACGRIDKFDKFGKLEVSYYVDLSKTLCCSCADVQKNGVVTCKHAYAYQLYREAKALFVQFIMTDTK